MCINLFSNSGTCRDTYGLPDSQRTTRGEETRAFCTSEYSDISPLKNGNVAFSTLEGRPSAYNFDSSAELQVSNSIFCVKNLLFSKVLVIKSIHIWFLYVILEEFPILQLCFNVFFLSIRKSA